MKPNRLWLPPLLWAVGIFGLSSLSFAPSEGPGFFQRYELDKVVHFFLYAGLGGLLAQALHRGHALRLPTALGLAILLTSAYGVSDEWHQSFVPGRHSSVGDWAADTAGALVAAGVYYWYESRTSREKDRGAP
jgi:VanZ family protein